MKTLITDRLLRGLKPAPAGKRTVVWDSAVPGLCVRVTDKGTASFSVMRRIRGDKYPMRRVLGVAWPVPFPAGRPLPYPLSSAREDARAMILDMAKGIDPRETQAAHKQAEAQRKANSFSAVCDEFLRRHVRKLRSAADVEATIRRELIPRWRERPIGEIGRRDVIALIEEIADSGRPAAARKAYALASSIFSYAVARGIVEASPCTSVKISTLIGGIEPRQRVLSDGEIRSLWQASEDIEYPGGPFIKLLLLTGQRLREVAGMSWSEIDLEKSLWVIPAERMKANTAHEVPLSAAVVDILKSLPRWATGDCVFTVNGRTPITGFSKLKSRIDSAMGEVAHWTFHDLRRTMRTGLGALPIPANVAELCIGHVQVGMHKIYDRHSYRSEKLRAFELWAARVAEIVEPTDDNIVRLKTA
jgi:integrase